VSYRSGLTAQLGPALDLLRIDPAPRRPCRARSTSTSATAEADKAHTAHACQLIDGAVTLPELATCSCNACTAGRQSDR
jgi:hypothetical protein